MKKLNSIVKFSSGSHLARIKSSNSNDDNEYGVYGQNELDNDLKNVKINFDTKFLKTTDKVNLLKTGDIVFSLISGSASIVQKERNNYIYTPNYLKLDLIDHSFDPKYLVYYLNESASIKRQLTQGTQGSIVTRITVAHIKDLNINKAPKLEVQKLIGEIYFNRLALEALEKKRTSLKTNLVFEQIKRSW